MRFRVPGLLLAASLVLGALAAPAVAHDEVGVLTLVAENTTGELQVSYEVSFIYSEDREPVEDAALTVVAEGPDAQVTAPVALEPAGEPGRYRGTVQFPAAGDWTVRFASVTPRATLERTQVVAEPVATSSTTTAPNTTSTLEELELRPVDGDGAADSSGSVWMLLVAFLLGTALVAGGLAIRSRRR